MKFLHTSDWHFGRTLHNQSLHAAQRLFVDHLVDVARSERVDAVLVSGDIFDRAVPPPEAVSLWDEVLTRLALEESVRVIAISGNHDSPARVGISSRLLDHVNVHIRTSPSNVGTPIVLSDEHGPVFCYPIPYLEPAAVYGAWSMAERSHAATLRAAMERVRVDLAERGPGRSVALAHAFVVGGYTCDTERDISVGGIQIVPTDVFTGIDYVALGHLHGRQRVTPSVQYSGSPVAFSFSEADHVKACLLVELDAGGLAHVEEIPVPVLRPLARLRGTLAELLSDARFAEHESSFVEITLTDEVRPSAPGEQLKFRFPHLLKLEIPVVLGDMRARSSAELAGVPPAQVALEFFADVRGRPAEPREEALLRRAFEELRLQDQEISVMVSVPAQPAGESFEVVA